MQTANYEVYENLPVSRKDQIHGDNILKPHADRVLTQVFPTPGEVSIHEYLLAGWGMPIGEHFTKPIGLD